MDGQEQRNYFADKIFSRLNREPEPFAITTAVVGMASGGLAVAAAERVVSSGINLLSIAETAGSLVLARATQKRSRNAYRHGIQHAEKMIKEVEDFTSDLH